MNGLLSLDYPSWQDFMRSDWWFTMHAVDEGQHVTFVVAWDLTSHDLIPPPHYEQFMGR